MRSNAKDGFLYLCLYLALQLGLVQGPAKCTGRRLNTFALARLITCGTVEEKIYRKQVFKGGLSRTGTEDGVQFRYFSQMARPRPHPGSLLDVCTLRMCGAFRLCSVLDRVRLRTRGLLHLHCHGKSVGALKGGYRRHLSGPRGSMRSQHPNQCSSHSHCSARTRRNCATCFGWSQQSWSTRSHSGSCTHCTAASAAHRPSLQRTSKR